MKTFGIKRFITCMSLLGFIGMGVINTSYAATEVITLLVPIVPGNGTTISIASGTTVLKVGDIIVIKELAKNGYLYLDKNLQGTTGTGKVLTGTNIQPETNTFAQFRVLYSARPTVGVGSCTVQLQSVAIPNYMLGSWSYLLSGDNTVTAEAAASYNSYLAQTFHCSHSGNICFLSDFDCRNHGPMGYGGYWRLNNNFFTTYGTSNNFSTVFIREAVAIKVYLLVSSIITGITPALISALTTAQIAAFTPAQIGVLTPAQIAALIPAQIGALTSAQLAALTTVQIGALTTVQIGALTTAQIAALTVAQIGVLTSAQIGVLTPAQIAALIPAQIGALTPAQIAALTAAQMGVLTPVQIAALNVVQLAALTRVQLAALTVVQLAALTSVQLAVLTRNQIGALPPERFTALTTEWFAALSQNQMVGLSLNQIAALTPAQTAIFNTSRLTGAQVAALTKDQIGQLTKDQMSVLTTAQISQLSKDQVGVLTKDQIAALKIGGLSKDQIGVLTPVQIAALTKDQIGLLTKDQIGALTAAQIGALTVAQIGALISAQLCALTTLQFNALTPAQIQVLTAAQTQAFKLGGTWISNGVAPDVTVAIQDLASGKWLQVDSASGSTVTLVGTDPVGNRKCQFTIASSAQPTDQSQAFRMNCISLKPVGRENKCFDTNSVGELVVSDCLPLTQIIFAIDALANGPSNALWLRKVAAPDNAVGDDGSGRKVFAGYFWIRPSAPTKLVYDGTTAVNGNTMQKNADGTLSGVATLSMYVISAASGSLFWPDDGYVKLTTKNPANPLPAGSLNLYNVVVQVQRTSAMSLDAVLQLGSSACLTIDAANNVVQTTMADDQIADHGDKFIPEATGVNGEYYFKTTEPTPRYIGTNMTMGAQANAMKFTITPASRPASW